MVWGCAQIGSFLRQSRQPFGSGGWLWTAVWRRNRIFHFSDGPPEKWIRLKCRSMSTSSVIYGHDGLATQGPVNAKTTERAGSGMAKATLS